jgi:hypothetical protein
LFLLLIPQIVACQHWEAALDQVQIKHKKTNSAFDDLKRTSSLDSPGHDEERLTVVETMDDSSQELSSNSARHPTPAAVVVPLIKSKVDSSSPSS